jgi:hypothetical protein
MLTHSCVNYRKLTNVQNVNHQSQCIVDIDMDVHTTRIVAGETAAQSFYFMLDSVN